MRKWLKFDRVLVILAGTLLFSMVIGLVLYGLFGHPLIETVYKSESIGIANKIMAGRAVIPLEEYYRAADKAVFSRAVGAGRLFLILLVLIVLVKKPLGLFLAGSSFLIFSFLLFCLLEVFPGLSRPLQLNNISYYAYKESYLPDDQLAFTEKPFIQRQNRTVMGGRYSRLYGVEVSPMTIDWATDREGFRNSRTMETADIVVVGDSFMEHGQSEADTFPRLLEKYSNGLTVANLGKAGYGPFQYLEVLKRYGIDKNPKYALFAFYEGNDIWDIRRYLAWKGGEELGARWSYKKVYEQLTSTSFSRRYAQVLSEVRGYIQDLIWVSTNLALKASHVNRGYADDVHPDVAVLDIGNKEYYMRFIDRLSPESADELLMTEEWKALRNILSEFQRECAENNIVPVILHIPMAARIYAQYSTERSGRNWLEIRDEQIAAKRNLQEAMARLSQELDMELIDLTPVFELAAKNGRMIYESLDAHWNAEGAEVAAAFVAKAIKDKLMTAPEQGAKL